MTITERNDLLLKGAGMPLHKSNRLTDREIEVVIFVSQGNQDKAIAEELGISPETVGRHLTSIFDKVGCEGRVQLAVWWERQTFEIEKANAVRDLQLQVGALECEIDRLRVQRDRWREWFPMDQPKEMSHAA